MRTHYPISEKPNNHLTFNFFVWLGLEHELPTILVKFGHGLTTWTPPVILQHSIKGSETETISGCEESLDPFAAQQPTKNEIENKIKFVKFG